MNFDNHSKAIKWLMKEKGLSVREVGAIMNCAPTTVRYWLDCGLVKNIQAIKSIEKLFKKYRLKIKVHSSVSVEPQPPVTRRTNNT